MPALGLPSFTPEYCTATLLSALVDMNPYSINPSALGVAHAGSARVKLSGNSSVPPRPRYSNVPGGMFMQRDSLLMADTSTKMVVGNRLSPSLNTW